MRKKVYGKPESWFLAIESQKDILDNSNEIGPDHSDPGAEDGGDVNFPV